MVSWVLNGLLYTIFCTICSLVISKPISKYLTNTKTHQTSPNFIISSQRSYTDIYTSSDTRELVSQMTKCFSLTGTKTWCYRSSLSGLGLRSKILDLGDGTVIHYWAPKAHKDSKPNLVLIHGFGANSMWQWADTCRHLAPYFNLYVPDLVFFGDSYTTRPERSEAFQARCVISVLEKEQVGKASIVGMSYGGFVAYSLAAQWPEGVERVVVCCAGVCLEEKDLGEGMFKVGDLDEAAEILLPRTPEKMRELLGYTLVRPPKVVPSCLLQDFIDEMFSENVDEKKELIRAIAKGRKLSDVPKISQPTLIIWGDQDQVFPLELGYRLKKYLGDNAELAVIENTGHAFILEKRKEFCKLLKSFLLDSITLSASPVPDL